MESFYCESFKVALKLQHYIHIPQKTCIKHWLLLKNKLRINYLISITWWLQLHHILFPKSKIWQYLGIKQNSKKSDSEILLEWKILPGILHDLNSHWKKWPKVFVSHPNHLHKKKEKPSPFTPFMLKTHFLCFSI